MRSSGSELDYSGGEYFSVNDILQMEDNNRLVLLVIRPLLDIPNGPRQDEY